jgi:biopolymer transport protein ExbD
MSTMIFLGPPPARRDLLPAEGAPPDAAVLEVTQENRILFGGSEVDFPALRTHLDLAAASGQWIDFRPHAHARYALFLEVLAVTRWARIEKLHLTHSAFAMDSDPAR